MVASGDVRPLAEIAQFTHASDISAREPGESLYNLQVRAFRKAYGITMIEFFEGWKEWVLKT